MILTVKIDKVANSQNEIELKGDTRFRIKILPKPDLSWVGMFDTAYMSTKTSSWRSCEIVGSDIVISCHHSQLKAVHIPALEVAIKTANEMYEKTSKLIEADRIKRLARETEQAASKEDILKNLNKDI